MKYYFVLIIAILSFQTPFAQSPITPAKAFNVFVRNSAKVSGSEIQGPIALGRELILNGQITVASQNAGTFKVANTTIGLLIGGKVIYQSGNSMNLNSNAYAKIGDCTGSKIWYQDNNGASSNIQITSGEYNTNPRINLQTNANNLGVSEVVNPVCEGNLIDFDAAFSTLQSNSTSISACTNTLQLYEPNGKPIYDYSKLTNNVNCTLSNGLNILNISGNSLNAIQQFKFNGSRPDANHYLVINIDAAGVFNFEGIKSSELGSGEGAYILYNFYNTTSLTIDAKDQVPGTIYAPFADITKLDSKNLIGQVIGQSFTMTDGLVQYALFTFNIPGCGSCVLPELSPISGPNAVCKSETIVLSNSTAGGVWSSDNQSIATVDNAGKVKGVSPGTAIIKYAVTNSCGTTTKTQSITVNSAPIKPSITANSSTDFCEGGSVTLVSSSQEFNQWYLDGKKIANAINNTYLATIAGRYSLLVSNTSGCGSVPANSVYITTSQAPNKPVISAGGPTSFCQGDFVDLFASLEDDNHLENNVNENQYEYQWYKNGVAISGETINRIRVAVSGIYTVTVTKSSGCTSVQSEGTTVTVNQVTTANPITGGSSLCTNGTLQLSNTTVGGVWTSSNVYIATVDAITGLVTGVKAGIVDIRYTVTNASNCSNMVLKTIIVNELPSVNAIVGEIQTCVNNTISLYNDNPAGVWSSSNTAIATVSTNGDVKGIAEGTVIIRYTVTNENNCAAFAEHSMAVKAIPEVGPNIVPQDQICVNGSVTLSNNTIGGSWTSSNPSIATVTANGIVTGIKVGVVLINYTLQNIAGCTNTVSSSIKVNAIPASPSISYNSSTTFCEGQSIVLTSSIATGNLWYRNGTFIDSANGKQTYTALRTGSYTVTTKSGCESVPSDAVQVTVNQGAPTPIISAGSSTTICDGGSVLLTSSNPDGNQWYKNGIIINGATSNTYLAGRAGTYTAKAAVNNCFSNISNAIEVTVNSLPGIPAISADNANICAGGSVLLTAVPMGTVSSYQWYLNGTAITGATSNTYLATQAGDYTVGVTNASGCSKSSTDKITVVVDNLPAQPSISAGGPTTFCSGGTVVLTSTSATGNTWYKDGTIISLRNGGQTYTANSAGVYTVVVTNAGGCNSLPSNALTVTINSIPTKPTINTSDPTTICSPLTATLNSSSNTGNQWYLNSVLIAGATNQNYIATASGNYTVVVTNASACSSLPSDGLVVTVNTGTQVPTIIALSSTTFCEGGSVTLISSLSSTSTIQWLKDGSNISGATTGIYTASSTGVYTVNVVNPTACINGTSAGKTVTANPNPIVLAILGNSNVCKNATTTLSSGTAGGVWSSDNDAIATVNSSGLVTGVSFGTVSIYYTVTQSGCTGIVSRSTTVNALPNISSISGPSTVCVNSSINLTNMTTGGVWSSSNTAIATVNASTGMVTGIAAGSVSIIYTVSATSGCTNAVSKNITVSPLPIVSAITGNAPICVGKAITLVSATTGGVWSSDDATIAEINSSNGIVVGYAAGSTTIRYTVTSNNCTSESSVLVTVNALPTVSAITGNTSACIGTNTTLSNTTSGGVWNSNLTTVASVSSTGIVTAVSEGTASISYSVTNSTGCTAITYTSFNALALPIPPVISASSATSFCTGDSVILTSNTNRNNQWYKNGVAIEEATGYYLLVKSRGTYTVKTANANGCVSTNSNAIAVTVTGLPTTPVISAGGPTSFCTGGSVILTANAAFGYQWYRNGLIIVGAVNKSYTATTGAVYTVVTSNSTGCKSSVSNGTTVTVNAIPQIPLINNNGPLSFCEGGTVVLSTNQLVGNQWYKNDVIISGATSQTYTANVTGSYTVKRTNSSGCTSTASLPILVTVNSLPAIPTITANGPVTFCEGDSILLTSSSNSGNQWYRNNSIINNAISASYSVTKSGNYSVVVTNANGCTSTSVNTNVTIHKKPTVAPITGDLFICNGLSTQLYNATPDGIWSSGNNAIATVNATGIVTGVSAGATTLFYKVSNTNGCIKTVTKPLFVQAAPSSPSVIANGPTTFCEGGSLFLTSSATSGNQWYRNNILLEGETDQSFQVFNSGNYSVIVSNNNGCISNGSSSPLSVTVNAVPNKPVISAAGSTIICHNSSVLLTSNATTGNQWFNHGIIIPGATGQSYLATTSGYFSVQTTNANGCSSTMSDITYVYQLSLPNTPIVNADGPLNFCFGDSVLLKSNSSTGNQWYRNGLPIPGQTNSIYSAKFAGVYSVIVTSSNGCNSPASAGTSVLVNPLPTVNGIIGNAAVCANTSTSMSNTTTGGIWSSTNESIAVINAQTGELTGVRFGTTLILYTFVSSNGCATIVQRPILVTPLATIPAISIDGNTVFCAGGSVTLTSSFAKGYQWYKNGSIINGATNRSLIASSSGYYSIITTNIAGCSSNSSEGVQVMMNELPSTPVISAGGPTTFCAGGSVLLSSSSVSGNQWYLNGAMISGATNQTLTVSAAGVYTLIATNASGCVSATSAGSTVTVNALPVVPSIGGPRTVCVGNSVTMTNGVSGGVWSSGNTTVASVNSSTGVVTGVSGGVVLINYTVTNASGCMTVVSTGFKVSSTPEQATISSNTPTSFCAGGSVDLISSSSGGNQWYVNGVIIAGATSQVYTATGTGNYTVTVTSGVGCISNGSSAGTVVTVNALPTVTAITGTTTVCVNSSTQLSNASTGGVWSSSNASIASVHASSGLVTGLSAGTATISYVLTNSSGCSASTTTNVTVNALPQQPTVSAGGSTLFCAGSSVVLTSSAGTSYQWYKNGTVLVGATVVSYTATTSGTYSVSVGNSNGCMSVASTGTPVMMNELPSTPVISAGGPTTFCAGGSVLLSSSSVSGNQWYLNGAMISGATNQTLTVSAAGVYTVIATNASGCVSATSAGSTVTVNALPVVPSIGGPRTVCVGNSVTMTNGVSGGVWSSGNTTVASVNSSTGVVTGVSGGVVLINYTVTNASGCMTVVSTGFKVSSTPEQATISSNTPTSFCAGGSVDLISSSSGGNQWYVNGVIIAGATSQVYTATGTGNYTVTVTSGVGCISNGSSAGTVVTVNALPTVTAITGTTTVCVNSSTQLSNASTGGVWSSSNASIASVHASSGLVTGLSAGTATISYVLTNSSGCTASTTTNVTVNALPQQPTVSAGGSTLFCAGSSVVLTSSAGTSYQWYKNGTVLVGATVVSYTATTSGTYSVSVGNSNGCMSVASTGTPVMMNELPSTPVISAGGPTTFCAGGSVLLSSSSVSGNQWYLNGAMISGATNQTLTVSAAGVYTVIATNASGCVSATSAGSTVTVNALPVVPSIGGPRTVCVGNSVTMTNGVSGGVWSSGNTTVASVNSSTGVVTGVSGGVVLINYTVTNASGCMTVVSTGFKVSSTPEQATISSNTPTSFCAGGSVDLISSSSGGNQWYVNGVIIAGATSQVYTATGTGNYTVTVTSGVGCISNGSSAGTVVTVNALPTVTAITGTTTVCVNSSTQLSNASTGGVWSSSNASIASVHASSGLVTGLSAGTATISYVLTNSSGCSASTTTNVTVNALPQQPTVSAGGSTLFCAGSSVVLTSSAGTSYQWYKNGTVLVGATVVSYTATTSGTYSVSVGNSNGCMSVASTGTPVMMNELPSTPVISAGGPTTFCAGGSVLLSSSSVSGNQWYLNGAMISGATNQTLTVSAAGVYTLIATNASGCVSATSAGSTVTVNALPVVPSIGGPRTVCVGNSVTMTNGVSGGVWSSGNTTVASVNSSTGVVTGVSGGVVLINYTVTNASGCMTVVSTGFKVSSTPEQATISSNTPTSFCAGGSVDLISSSSGGNQWYVNGVIIAGATSQVYTATGTGNYTVTVTSGVGCISNGSSAGTVVTVNALPTVTAITGTTTVCVNSSTQLSNASTGGVWSSSNASIASVHASSGLVTGLSAGTATISYVLTNSSGCSASTTTNVTVNALPQQPTVSAGGSTLFCAGSSVVLTSSAGTSYQWYKNGTVLVGATVVSYTATTSGTYSVSVGNSNGCMSVASTGTPVMMNELPSTPVISAGGPTTFCAGGSVLLSSSSVSGNQWYLNGAMISGATNQTLTVSAAGVYTVIATNASGCVSATSAGSTVTVNALPVVPSIGGPRTVCVGNSVTMTNGVSGGVWSSGNTTVASVNSSTGVVTGVSGGVVLINYTVTNASGCMTVVSTGFKVSSTPEQATISSNTPTSFCAGGSVDLISSSSGGNQWYVNGVIIAGATSQVYTATGTGNYTVTVTSGVGCISNGSSAGTVVTVNALPTVTAITGTTTVCVNSSTQLSNASTGGVWSSSNASIASVHASSGLVTGLSAGTATISYVLTNSSGCTASTTTNVTVNALPQQPTVSAGGSTLFCAGSSVVLTSSAGTSYQWYKNGTVLVGATVVSYTATTSGTYSVSVGNSNGCMSVASTGTPVMMNELPSTPVISAGGPTTFCAGGSVLLSSSSVSGNQWYLNGAMISGATNQTLTVQHSGTYTVVTIMNGCNSLNSNAIVVVENSLPTAPVISAAGPLSFCAGNSVLLTSTSGSTYQWLKDGIGIVGQTNQTYTVTTSGNYQVSIKDINGCRSADLSNRLTVVVNEIPATPSVFTSRPTSFCNGDSTVIQSSATSGNQWYKDGIAIAGANDQNLIVKTAGQYSVKVTNSFNCSSLSVEPINIILFNVPSKPIITLTGSGAICKGDSVLLQSSALNGNKWYLNNSIIPGANSKSLYASLSGSYIVTETNINGCNSAPSDGKLVIVSPTPDTPFISVSSNTTFCIGANVILNSTTAAAYQWYKNDIVIAGATNQNYTATETGLYKVEVANILGCKTLSNTTIPVNAIPLPVGSIFGSVIRYVCINGSTTLEAIGGVTYKWFKDGVLIPGNSTHKLEVTLPGIYSVSLLNGYGCEMLSDKTVRVFQIQKPTADYVYDSYCVNKLVNFKSTSNVAGSGPVSYTWTEGSIPNKFTSSSPSYQFKNPGTLNIKLVVAPYFCPLSSDSITKQVVIESPTPAIRMPAVDVAKNEIVPLKARTFGNSYLWTPPTYLSNATIFNPTITTSVEQTYQITIQAVSGCTTVDTLLVRVHDGNTIYIPTVFTPNGDGLNDKLYLNYVGIRELKVFRVYNRWGKIMHETTDMNNPWDGTLYGVKQSMDTYTVVIEAIDVNGKIIRKQGSITLLR